MEERRRGVNRRDFLRLVLVSAGAAVLNACKEEQTFTEAPTLTPVSTAGEIPATATPIAPEAAVTPSAVVEILPSATHVAPTTATEVPTPQTRLSFFMPNNGAGAGIFSEPNIRSKRTHVPGNTLLRTAGQDYTQREPGLTVVWLNVASVDLDPPVRGFAIADMLTTHIPESRLRALR